MLYMQVTGQVMPGRLMELKKLLADELFPLFEKYGAKVVGSWQTIVGTVEEFTDLYAFDSMAHYEQVMRSMVRDPAWWPTHAKGRSLVSTETTKFLWPLVPTEQIK